jgi:hypothetical protein
VLAFIYLVASPSKSGGAKAGKKRRWSINIHWFCRFLAGPLSGNGWGSLIDWICEVIMPSETVMKWLCSTVTLVSAYLFSATWQPRGEDLETLLVLLLCFFFVCIRFFSYLWDCTEETI